MSTIQSVSEKFEDVMMNVSEETFYAPAAIMESRQSKIKAPPLSDAKKKIVDNADAKKAKKAEAKKNLTEAAEKISDLYTTYILEGVLDSAKDVNPESAEKIEALKLALAEAALGAKEFLA